jgi:hypothetical protein
MKTNKALVLLIFSFIVMSGCEEDHSFVELGEIITCEDQPAAQFMSDCIGVTKNPDVPVLFNIKECQKLAEKAYCKKEPAFRHMKFLTYEKIHVVPTSEYKSCREAESQEETNACD